MLCSALLYGGFVVCFRRAGNFRVSRWLLLLCLLFVVLVPLVEIAPAQRLAEESSEQSLVEATVGTLSELSTQTVEATSEMVTGAYVSPLMGLYGLITAFLLGRFVLNLYPLVSGKFVRERTDFQGVKVALIDQAVGPFSFWDTIYLNRAAYHAGQIDEALLLHEMGHVRQGHTLDILLVELMQVFYWFNPFVYLFKKRMQANHEYLADAYALEAGVPVAAYAEQLLHYTVRDQTSALASGFNYALIKNRLLMLSTHDQPRRGLLRLTVFASLMLGLLLFTVGTQAKGLTPTPELAASDGYFYGERLTWSGPDQKVYVKGKVEIKVGENDITGNGTFSFLGKVGLLIVDGKSFTPDTTLDIAGKKCSVTILSPTKAREKYGHAGRSGAVEIFTSQ